ncbi:MAG: TIM barrel protein [Candidatus Nanoarchaeia archaeon]|nr:TIM barrel protein [Candidatus Nanoarchaeia archaeon]
MKIGVKTFNDPAFLRHFEKDADFFEIMAIEGKDYSFLSEFSKPIIIHAQHHKFGINNSDKTKHQKNSNSIKFARDLANKNQSTKIIVHPGELIDNNCSLQESLSFINSLNDSRTLIENMPHPQKYLCSTPEQMAEYIKETGLGFCFDINHAISAALVVEKDPYSFIEGFVNLKPSHYHLCGHKIKDKDITHLNFVDSEIDLKKIFSMLPKDAEITLEIPNDVEKTEKDIEMIRSFI